jgi:hypothetical protein
LLLFVLVFFVFAFRDLLREVGVCFPGENEFSFLVGGLFGVSGASSTREANSLGNN